MQFKLISSSDKNIKYHPISCMEKSAEYYGVVDLNSWYVRSVRVLYTRFGEDLFTKIQNNFPTFGLQNEKDTVILIECIIKPYYSIFHFP